MLCALYIYSLYKYAVSGSYYIASNYLMGVIKGGTICDPEKLRIASV